MIFIDNLYCMNRIHQILLIFLFFVLTSSSFLQLQNYFYVQLLMSYLSKISFLISLFIAIKYKVLFCRFNVFLFVCFALLLLCSKLNGVDTLPIYPIFIKIAGITFLFESYCEKYLPYLLKIFSVALIILLVLNALIMLFCPALMGVNKLNGNNLYLLSTNYNQFGGIFILSILYFAAYKLMTRQNTFSLLILILFSLGIVFYCGSVTSSISILILTLYYLFSKFNMVRRYFINIVFFLSILIFFFLVFPILDFLDVNVLSSVFSDLGKDITFSGRVYIWEYTLAIIPFSPIWGYGYYDIDWALNNIYGVMPHNTILQILLHGGFVYLLVMSIFVFLSFKKTCSIDNRKLRDMILISYVVIFLMMQFEFYNYFIMFAMLLLPFLCRKYINNHA